MQEFYAVKITVFGPAGESQNESVRYFQREKAAVEDYYAWRNNAIDRDYEVEKEWDDKHTCILKHEHGYKKVIRVVRMFFSDDYYDVPKNEKV